MPSWPVLELPGAALLYVLALPAVALLVAGGLLPGLSWDRRDGVLAVLLLGAAGVSVEATRRLGEPAGTVVRDLLSVWWLPMAVLLPPVYVLLAPVPLMALTQWRVRPTLIYRRVFSAAAIGLAYAVGSIVWHATVGPGGALPSGSRSFGWAVTVAMAGLSATALNAVFIAVAVKAVDAQTTWRDLLLDGNSVRLDAMETCLGVTAAVLIGLSPGLVVFALPPVLLLQRGLLHAQLRADARMDAKTGVLNMPSWEREAQGKLLALRRRDQSAAVLLIDIDHFKAVNDTYGHLAGDEVLKAVAGALQGALRDGDTLGRFGGEEFVALLPAASPGEAALVAELVRRHVAELAVHLQSESVQVTVSIGVANGGRAAGLQDLLAAADDLMYRAKAGGRDQVVCPAPTT